MEADLGLELIDPNLKVLQKEYAETEAMLLEKRRRIELDKDRARIVREDVLAEKLRVEHERQADLQAQIARYKEQLIEKQAAESALAADSRNLELQGTEQTVAFQEMRVERIAQASRVLDQEIMRKRGELAAISELLAEGDIAMVTSLVPKLDGTAVGAALRHAYPDTSGEVMRELAAETSGAGAASSLRVVDTIIGRRTQERQRLARARQMEMQALNEERRAIVEERAQLEKQKVSQFKSTARADKPLETPEQILDRAQATMIEQEHMIVELKNELLRQQRIRQPFIYDGRWARSTYPAHRRDAFDATYSLVESIVSKAVEQATANDPDAAGTRIQRQMNQQALVEIETRGKQRLHNSVTVDMYGSVLRECVEEAIAAIYHEISETEALVSEFSLEVLTNLVLQQAYGGFGQTMERGRFEKMVQSSWKQMRSNRAHNYSVVRHRQQLQLPAEHKGRKGKAPVDDDDDVSTIDIRKLRPYLSTPTMDKRGTLLAECVFCPIFVSLSVPITSTPFYPIALLLGTSKGCSDTGTLSNLPKQR